MGCWVPYLQIQTVCEVYGTSWTELAATLQIACLSQLPALQSISDVLTTSWPHLLNAVEIVVMGILTLYLVRINRGQKEINEVDHETRLLTSRVRAVDDDGTDRFHLRLSNSGGGAARDIEVSLEITDIICMEYDDDGNPTSDHPIRTGVGVLPETYVLELNRFDLNRVYDDGEESGTDSGDWIATAGNNLQGNEMDVLFEFVANIHLNSTDDSLNFRSALRDLVNVDLDDRDIKGIELTLTLDYEGELESPEPLTLIEYVVPVSADLTLEEAMKMGMQSAKFDQNPSRLLTGIRFS